MYAYIVKAEIILLIDYHFDTLEFFEKMTLLEFEVYLDGITEEVQKKSQRYSNSKLLATQLHVLRNVLNNMDV